MPTLVPTITAERGKTKIIKIKNGIDLKIFISQFKMLNTGLGSGSILSFSPTTNKIPRGSPIITAKSVASIVA